MKKIISIILMLIICMSVFAACSEKLDAGTTELVFYRARSNNMSDGTYDDDVTKALEDKFYEDTGNKIKLTMKMYSGDDLPTQVDANYNRAKSQMDAVSHYVSEDGGSAILKYAKEPEATLDLEPLLEQYGQHILEAIRKNDTDHLAERAAYVPVNGEFKMNILPSYEQERCFGILLRKDMVEAVEQKTGIIAEKYDVLNDDYENMSFADFDKVMRAIKEQYAGKIQYPVTGAAWDIGRVFAPVFGVDYMNSVLDQNGKIVPSQLNPNYDKYLELMYTWAKDGVWEKDSANMQDDKRLNMFVSGQAACFIAYPEITNLITVANKFNAANNDPNAELMMIAPLKNDQGVVNGFMKESRCFEALILPFKTKNAELTIKFIDWMYSDAENYELAKYGIKGVHWVDGEDFVVGDKTYKTWQYPDEKTDEFNLKKPYSGMWEILPNINVSNRINAGYSTNEKTWYVRCTQEFEFFGSEETESYWFADTPSKYNQEADKLGFYVGNIRGKAWAGIEDDQGRTPMEMWRTYCDDIYVSCADYLNYLDGEYKKAQSFFAEKF